MPLVPDDLDIGDELFWEPIRLVPPNPWVGHLAFAFWLVKVLRPRTVVELGTHSGNSFGAFCQAIATLDTGSRAFAVDTWEGDEHSGFYGGEVLADLAAFINAHHAGFATLLRTTFDNARAYFADGNVDLLHIDGLHTEDAVRHDLETWRATLSHRAVVVIHDINVRERGFGVWRLWRELAAEFPAFEFDHSNGLGVLGIGDDLPASLRLLFEIAGDPQLGSAVRRLFAVRGDSFVRRLQVQESEDRRAAAETAAEASRVAAEDAVRRVEDQGRLKDGELARREEALGWSAQLLLAKDHLVGSQDALLGERSAALRAHAAMVRARDRVIEQRDAEIEAVRDQLRRRADAVENLERQIGEWSTMHAGVLRDYENVLAQERQAHREQLRRHGAEAQELVERFRRSRYWRMTAPLRLAVRAARRVSGRPGMATPGAISAPVPESVPESAPTGATAPPAAATPAEPAGDARTALRALLRTRLEAFLASSARLRLPDSSRPDVSIILVLFNQAELTFGCLASIAETLGAGPMEVELVILDNGSTDATASLLDRIDGATVISSPENLHFLRGVNRAVPRSGGRHILLLNNDAQLLPGAVEAARRTLDASDTIGAVGARIILPDGTLQEAGSIVWADGTCVGYGRGRDPSDAEFMFRRDVDYCSGAFLLTPRAVWDRLGGFDEAFAPAYYEETDYCLRLWEAGLRVVYDPEATILHYEFGSADSSEQALALQQRNWHLFAARHADWLRGQYPPSAMNAWLARTARRLDGAPRLRRVLMIEDRVPKAELGAGYPRSREILHELVAAGAEVTFFPTYRHTETWVDIRRAIGPSVEVPIRAQADQLRPFLLSRRGMFDAILVCRPHNMKFLLDAVDTDRSLIGHARLIYDAEAVVSRRDALRAELDGTPFEQEELERRTAEEMTLTRLADVIVSVSPLERKLFEQHGLEHVHLLGHVLEPAPTAASFQDRSEILFVGSLRNDFEPNADSLRWFAREILPALRRQLGCDLRLTVVGPAGAPSVMALDGTAFDVVGAVEDLQPWFARARLMVVPTRFAAGIPHKVHQAAAFGVPVVATTLIAQQLGWADGQDLLAADDPAAFARHCAALYQDQALWQTIRDSALERCRQECSASSFRRTVRTILEAVPVADRAGLDTRGPLVPAGPPAAPDRLPGYVGRSAESDYSVAVPFGYPPDLPPSWPSVAVVCHIFHTGVAAEIRRYLDNLPLPADLFISTDTEAKRALLADMFGDWPDGDVKVRTVPNRGRDIAPKLIAFPEAHDRYEYVLHLHSKQSPHDPRLAPWRGFLLENLLGSPEVVRSILEAFARDPRLGMVSPQHFEYIRRWLDWGGNYRAAQAVAAEMGIRLAPERALDFPSGSMFWARTAALRPLLDLRLTFDDFPEEGGQQDSTPAHAIERLYFLVCEQAGYDWLKIARPELYLDRGTIVAVDSPAALARFVTEHGIRLTGPHPPKPAPHMPDLVREVSPGLLAALADRRTARRPRQPVTSGA